MMNQLNRLLTYAQLDSLLCVLTLIAGLICLAGFFRFDAAHLAEHVSPVFYIFGAWPFFGLLLVGVMLSELAYEKTRRQ